jgi:hypothetical protein
MLRETWSTNEGGVQQTFGYAATYYPESIRRYARRVTLADGSSQSMSLNPVTP